MNFPEIANSVTGVVKPMMAQEYSLCMEMKNSYGKCRGHGVTGREKVFSPFSHLFHSTFESMFCMKGSHEYKGEYFGFPSPFSRWKAGPHYQDSSLLALWGLLWLQVRSAGGAPRVGSDLQFNGNDGAEIKLGIFPKSLFYWQFEWPTVFCSRAFHWAFVLLTRECSFVKD